MNALAGGGTLITFPALIALGVPAVAANVTNTVALCPGYLGATLAQWNDLRDQKKRLWLLMPASIIGGVLGGILLLNTQEKVFQTLVPFLILLASGLLVVQDRLRNWVMSRSGQAGSGGALEVVDNTAGGCGSGIRRLFRRRTECDRAGSAGTGL